MIRLRSDIRSGIHHRPLSKWTALCKVISTGYWFLHRLKLSNYTLIFYFVYTKKSTVEFTIFKIYLFPAIKKMKKITMFATTIVAPTGVEKSIEAIIPTNAAATEITAEQTITPLKLF